MRRLGYLSLLPKFVPREGDWTQLGELPTATLRQLSTEDFLIRLNLRTDLDAAAEAKAERELGEQKSTEVAKAELAATSTRSASESDSTSSTSPPKASRKVAFGPEVTPGGICAGNGVRFSSPKPNSSKD